MKSSHISKKELSWTTYDRVMAITIFFNAYFEEKNSQAGLKSTKLENQDIFVISLLNGTRKQLLENNLHHLKNNYHPTLILSLFWTRYWFKKKCICRWHLQAIDGFAWSPFSYRILILQFLAYVVRRRPTNGSKGVFIYKNNCWNTAVNSHYLNLTI